MRKLVIGLALTLGGCGGETSDEHARRDAGSADAAAIRCFDALGHEMNCSNAAALCQAPGACAPECDELRRCYLAEDIYTAPDFGCILHDESSIEP